MLANIPCHLLYACAMEFTTRFEMLSVFIAGQEVVVSSGGAPTPAGTSMFTI